MTFIYRKVFIENIDEMHDELVRFALPYSVDKPTGLWALDLDEFKTTCPKCVDYFDSISQLNNLFKTCIVVVHPKTTGRDAHVDNNIEPPIDSGITKGCISFNFDIQNGINTSVIFYKYISGDKKIVALPDATQGSYIFYSGCEMEELGRYTLKTPAIMNNTVPHAILNDTELPRISLSFRFKVDPWEFAKTYEFG
jgi:hypothetical protein